MTKYNVANHGKAAFEKAVSDAQKGDVIVYHIGSSCNRSPSRRMAMGAYQAGLVILVKVRLSFDNGGVFSHRALRTKKPWHPFFEARDEDNLY